MKSHFPWSEMKIVLINNQTTSLNPSTTYDSFISVCGVLAVVVIGELLYINKPLVAWQCARDWALCNWDVWTCVVGATWACAGWGCGKLEASVLSSVCEDTVNVVGTAWAWDNGCVTTCLWGGTFAVYT